MSSESFDTKCTALCPRHKTEGDRCLQLPVLAIPAWKMGRPAQVLCVQPEVQSPQGRHLSFSPNEKTGDSRFALNLLPYTGVPAALFCLPSSASNSYRVMDLLRSFEELLVTWWDNSTVHALSWQVGANNSIKKEFNSWELKPRKSRLRWEEIKIATEVERATTSAVLIRFDLIRVYLWRLMMSVLSRLSYDNPHCDNFSSSEWESRRSSH